jgi:hypothetical protein
MNAIEEAQCRVARAQEERDKLHEEIMQKHGALRDLDTACKAEKAKDSCAMYNGKAHRLRQNYQKSVAELRLAKSALERERNEAKQAEERPAPNCKDHGRERELRDDGLMYCCRCGGCLGPEILPNGDAVIEFTVASEDCKGCVHLDAEYDQTCLTCEPSGDESGNPTHYEPAATGPWWEGGPLDTVNGMPWHVAVAKCPVGDVVILKPGTYDFISDEGGRLGPIIDAPYQVYGPITPDEALLQIIRQPQGPPRPVRARPDDEVKAEREEDLKRFLTRRIAEEEAASAARRQVQLDLELQPVKLPEGVVEDIKVSRKRVYREDFYTLSISEGDLANFSGLSFDAKRQTVATKLRIKPDEDDDFDPDDVPDQIRHFVRILDLAALRLKGERAAMEAKEALQALRGEA